jgi:hypothetical protein
MLGNPRLQFTLGAYQSATAFFFVGVDEGQDIAWRCKTLGVLECFHAYVACSFDLDACWTASRGPITTPRNTAVAHWGYANPTKILLA